MREIANSFRWMAGYILEGRWWYARFEARRIFGRLICYIKGHAKGRSGPIYACSRCSWWRYF